MYVTGFGGATYDLHIKCDDRILLGDSNPASTKSSPGGVMRNILDNLARLGTEAKFVSRVGDDTYGEALIKSLEDLGVDVSGVKKTSDYATAKYIDFLSPEGDMVVAANDMKIIDDLPVSQLDETADMIRNSSALIMDANLSPEVMKRFTELAGDIPIFFDTVSVHKAERVLGIIDKIFLLKPNLLELVMLTEMPCSRREEISLACDKLLDMGVRIVCVSIGERGCFVKKRGEEGMFLRLKPIENMANATGAGDAFTAGLVHAYLMGKSLKEMAEFALACGRLAVQSEYTINPEMSEENVLRELERGREDE